MQCTKKLNGIARASKCLSNTKPAVILTSPELRQWIKSLIGLFFLTIYLATCYVLTLATIWEWSSKTSECTGWRNDYYFNSSFSRWRMIFFPLEFISSCFVDLIHLLPYESTHIFWNGCCLSGHLLILTLPNLKHCAIGVGSAALV